MWRTADGSYRALLGDPRNDESVIIAGLHCAHILFYNRVLDELHEHDLRHFPTARHADRHNRHVRFLIAREVTLWHYQWLLVNEHLPQIAGQAVVNDVLRRGNRFYRPRAGQAFMPIEFGAAAYRFGHSMVRPSYRANFTSGTGDSGDPTANPFFALGVRPQRAELLRSGLTTTAPTCSAATRPRDATSAGRPSSTSATARSRTTRRSTPRSPASCSPCRCPRSRRTPRPRPTVLPQRNLLRQLTWGIPSGQAVARAMRAPTVAAPSCPTSARSTRPFATSTPLWYYILAEAKALAGGLHLGPVGGRIVTETLIGLLRADPTSYLSVYPRVRAVSRRRPEARTDAQPEHHRQPRIHPRALPPLRRRRHPRQVPMTTQLLTPTLSLPALTRRQTWPESR